MPRNAKPGNGQLNAARYYRPPVWSAARDRRVTRANRYDAPRSPLRSAAAISGRRSYRLDLDQARSEAVDNVRFTASVGRFYRLGPRVLAELLAEFAALTMQKTWLERRLEDYNRLTPELLAALNGGQLPEPPIQSSRNERPRTAVTGDAGLVTQVGGGKLMGKLTLSSNLFNRSLAAL